MFKPVITDNGICFAFNCDKVSNMLVKNSYMDAFHTVFEPAEINNSILLNENSGKSYQLFMILDSHDHKVYDSFGASFKIPINQASDVGIVRDNAVEAEVGFFTKIKVTPTQYTSTEGFKELEKGVRKCCYPHENSNENSLFR